MKYGTFFFFFAVDVIHFYSLQALSRDVYNLESQTQDETEFVDLGSSKQEKTLDCENGELISAMGSESQKDWFEKQWFSFADSIEENMYYIPPNNTHGCST